jgi:hypothetical protein
LLQAAVPNYKDIDLSFMYEIQLPTSDAVNLRQNSPYSLLEKYICTASKVAELQMSSPQIAEFIRFAEVHTLIA